MKGWQIDAMVENERNRAWEELNAPDPYEQELIKAAKELTGVLAGLNKAILNLMEASSLLSDTPVQPKVESYIDSLMSVESDLNHMKDCWERGDRE